MPNRYNILIVDDEQLNLKLLADMLDNERYLIDSAANGKIAWEMVRNKEYHMLITDIRMPVMDGIELLRVVKEYNPRIPVVVVTAFATVETAVEALRLGAYNFLKKPFSIEEIQEIARKGLKVWDLLEDRTRLLPGLTKTLQVSIPNDHNLINPIFCHIADDARDLGFNEEILNMNIYLALSEAVANAMDHGNQNVADRQVHITVEVNVDTIKIVVSDEGDGFDYSSLPDPTNVENIFKSRGRGVFLMKCYMDEVHYNDEGTCVTMVKRREEPISEPS